MSRSNNNNGMLSMAVCQNQTEELCNELDSVLANSIARIRRVFPVLDPLQHGEAPGAAAAATSPQSMRSKIQWHSRIFAVTSRSTNATAVLQSRLKMFLMNDLTTNVSGKMISMCEAAVGHCRQATLVGSTSPASGLTNLTVTPAAFRGLLDCIDAVNAHYNAFCSLRRFVQAIYSSIYNNGHSVLNSGPEQLCNVMFYDHVYLKLKDNLSTVLLCIANCWRRKRVATALRHDESSCLLEEISKDARPEDADLPVEMSHIQTGLRLFAEINVIAPAGNAKIKTAQSGADFMEQFVESAASYYRRIAQGRLACMKLYTSLQEHRASGEALPATADYLMWVREQLAVEEQLCKNGHLTDFQWRFMEDALLQSMIADVVEKLVDHPVIGLRATLASSWPEHVKLGKVGELLHMIRRTKTSERGIAAVGKVMEAIATDSLRPHFAAFQTACLSETGNGAEGGDADAGKHVQTAAAALLEAICTVHRHWFVVVIPTVCENHPALRKSVHAAFEAAFHGYQATVEAASSAASTTKNTPLLPTCANLIAVHLDLVCRGDLKELSARGPDAAKERIESVVALLLYIRDRDIFEDAYRARLAWRLLRTSSMSASSVPTSEFDHHVLNCIRMEWGRSLTDRIEVMLRDASAAERLTQEYREHRGSQALADVRDVELDVKVLTQSHWPPYKVDTFVAPAGLLAVLRSFETFYAQRFSGRSLRWLSSLGTSVVNVKLPRGAYDVEMSVVQAGVLLTLSGTEGQRLPIHELERRLGVSGRDVRDSIAPMYLARAFALLTLCDAAGTPCPPNPQLPGTDVVGLNAQFVAKLRKFKLPPPPRTTRCDMGQVTDDGIAAMRRAVTDAAIVRTMKSHRTLTHSELHEEVLRIISRRFEPTNAVRFIKERIEDLIVKDYLKRAEAVNTYTYVA